MKYFNFPLNQHKTIKTRKIMKLRKIKKRKTKVPKEPIANCDHGKKTKENKIKKNESNSGISSIEQISQRLNLLREKINILINGRENPTNNGANIHSCNINNSNGNEFNPQNGNANNNHPNMMHLLLYDLFHNFDDFSFRINRTEIRNIKKKLTKIKFKNTESSSGNGEKCIICYENFKKYQKIYSLPCHHLFHINCLNKEIKYRQKCPICRKEL